MFCPRCGTKNTDNARFCINCGASLTPAENPLPQVQSSKEPGRGALILTLGILSVVLLGFILGIPAWVMGNHDNKKIRSGLIDPSEKGPTVAGMVLGIIGTFLWAFGIIIIVLTVLMTAATFNALKKPSTANLSAVSTQPGLSYYDSINQIRGQTVDETPSVFVVRVSLGYDPADKQISVEIGMREREIQNLILKLLSEKTAADLSPTHYDDLQEELKSAINAIMTNGKIQNVVFRELTVVK